MSREGKGRELREQAVALRETNAFEPLAQAVERLALEAGDPPDEACIAMAQSLVSPGTASRIVAILGTTRDDARRAELMLVCRRVGHEMALAVADALSDTTDRFARRTFLDCMVAMGAGAMPVVQEMAEDSRWFVARNAVAILGETGGDRAVELITGTLAHKDPRVRREALMALAKVGGDDAGQLVYGMLEDADPDVRFAAAMAAGALKVDRALRPLLALLEDEEDDDVTVSILRALGQLGDPGAVATVEKYTVTTFFSRLPSEVRIAAYRALHNIGTPHAKEVIGAAVDDKDPEVRSAVRRLLDGS
jgi:HEAT repeat protein